jgi:hypothetical protein
MKNRIKNRVLNTIAFAIFTKEQFTLQAEDEAYEQMIAESQAKIGPYVPQTCPVQIWA